ncbi:MAG: hypothetical protein ACHQ03_11685 [Candidatus Bathyarchaeia archaeon]
MHAYNQSGNVRIAVSLILLTLLIGVAFLGTLPQLGRYVAADSSLVQKNNNVSSSCTSTCQVAVAFPSSVTSGDVVVVAITDELNGFAGSVTISDSLSSSYSLATSVTDSQDQWSVLIYDTTLTSSGADTVTVTDSSGNSKLLYASIFEVSGVTTTSAQTGTNTGYCSPACSAGVTTSSSASFIPGAFLLAMVASDVSSSSAGTGFTGYGPNPDFLTEYATSSVSSPTYFPASLTSLIYNEVEAGIALQPEVTTTVTSTTTTTTTSTSTIFVLPTTTHVHCIPSKVHLGKPVTCTAIVKSSTLPSGTVSFAYTEGKVGGVAPPVACTPIPFTTSCSASVVFNFQKTGNAIVAAAYSGDLTHQPSHGATLVRVYT